MAEVIHRCRSIDEARNAAIKWLESYGAIFDQNRRIEIGHLGDFENTEVGVSSTAATYWRIRIDNETVSRDGTAPKGGHFNVEFGKKGRREKAAFLFPLTDKQLKKLQATRSPR